MNKLGSAGSPGIGSFLLADPATEHDALADAGHAAERRAITALKERQNGNGNGNGNGKH
jgi:ubiquinol-cytochrome c reductase cytochrome b subunit